MLVQDAELPLLAHDDPALAGDRFHEALDDLAGRGWLVRSDLGYIVLRREPGMALLKDRRLSFPAVELLELQGLSEGIIHDSTTRGLMAQSGQAHARLRRPVAGHRPRGPVRRRDVPGPPAAVDGDRRAARRARRRRAARPLVGQPAGSIRHG